jgi:glycine cleavage system H protein
VGSAVKKQVIRRNKVSTNTTPAELSYTEHHVWVRLEDDETVVIGLTDYLQSRLGEVVFVELPDVGIRLNAGDEVGVAESVKTTTDIYAPISGVILAVNEDLEESPSLLNSDPYGDGWLFKMKPSDLEELEELLDAESYVECVAEEEQEG